MCSGIIEIDTCTLISLNNKGIFLMLFVGKTVNKKRLIYYSLLFTVLLLQDYENDNHMVNIYSPTVFWVCL